MRKTKTTKHGSLRRFLLLIIAAVFLLSAVIVGMCLINERPATQAIQTYQDAFPETEIRVSNNGDVAILPMTANDAHTGLIFYVGAQIKPDAYIPLLARIAKQGYSCFIPNLTCNMAALEPNAAAEIIKAYPEVENWYLAGHSMGGLTASGFADDHKDEISGLILLAAYSNRDMSLSDMPMLAIFGDTDSVMNRSLYEKRMPWNSADFEEYILPGGNHAQFGDYGKQPRDTDALISMEEQQTQTADIVLDWLKRHETAGGNNAQ